jgi:arginine-tRNA-protein transferase
MKDELSEKQFYLTPSHPCSYLNDRSARTLFLDPREAVSQTLYSALSSAGFRRSGSHLYRPHCEGCQACVPVRVPVSEFRWSRRFRRIRSVNADLRITLETPVCTASCFDLYARYIEGRHWNGDMYPPSEDQFRSFLLSSWSRTTFLTLHRDAELVGVAVTDTMDDGLSAIYTFFDPTLAARSLGVFAILSQIQHCQSLGLPYLYMGYWIRDCAKMRYKTDFRPVELLINDRWVRMN